MISCFPKPFKLVLLKLHQKLKENTMNTNSTQKLSISTKILIGMSAGFLFGLIARLSGLTTDINLPHYPVTFYDQYITTGFLEVIGTWFIRSLKMLVVPLVFVSLVCGTCNLADPSKLGRVGIKTLLFYLTTTAIAIALAIVAAIIVEPGVGAHAIAHDYAIKKSPTLVQTLINIIPENPIEAMTDTKMLQIIVFALLFGISIALIKGKSGERVKQFFNDINEVIMKLVTILMNLAPYGVFALIAKLTSRLGVDVFKQLGLYFIVVIVVLFIHGLIVYPTLLRFLAKINPITFLKKMRPAQLFAFSTASSNATLPVTMEVNTRRLGVASTTASFTLPLGATINMDGTAIMQGVATVFIAQFYEIPLHLTQYLTVILAATMASVGTAGVPGVGLITLASVLALVGLPAEGIGMIIGIDRILDMVRTAVNITGDSVVTCIVARSEGELDETIFNDPDAGSEFEDVEFPQ